MGNTIDDYIKDVIKVGDEGSKLLASLTAPSLKNSKYIDVVNQGMNGLAVLRIPKYYYVVVHSAGGDSNIMDVGEHAASLVDRLVKDAKMIGARPIGFANVVDSNTGDLDMLTAIGNALLTKANKHKVAILNGENAILGDRVVKEIQANVSGTMISVIPKKKKQLFFGTEDLNGKPMNFNISGRKFAVFDPKGKAVMINSDGVGTKTEFYERIRSYVGALRDSLAMKLDDTIKFGATAMVVSDIIETKGSISIDSLAMNANKLGRDMGFVYTLQEHRADSRIQSYVSNANSINISGSVVSVIDEEFLKNPPKPSAGESLIAIVGMKNPRSNGITDKRKIMVELFGEKYHLSEEGKIFLQYLAEPSTVLYPVFKKLMDSNLATSVYHMSGGAYNSKLAKPLAENGLYANINNLFEPDWRELTLGGRNFTSAKTAYSKWPEGTDGFITTSNPEEALQMIRSSGLKGRVVSVLEQANDKNRIGIRLKAYNGKTICYKGK